MGRHKDDGRGRLGGRQKGTPNKITELARSLIQKWLELHNSKVSKDAIAELIWEDFVALDPKERIKVSVEFIKLVLPRQIDLSTEEKSRTIEDRLKELCGETDEDN